MAYTTVNKSSSFHATNTWTGNNYDPTTISGLGFQPDLVWAKARTGTYATQNHCVNDSVRGANNLFRMGLNNAEETDDNNLLSFTSNGWTMGNDGKINQASTTYQGWSWKAGTTSGLSGGDITPTGYSINTTSKFGIYAYTGNGTSGATIAHGLGAKPACIWIKARSRVDDLVVGHHMLNSGSSPWNYHWKMRATSRTVNSGSHYWNNTAPTDTVFSLGNDTGVNSNGENYVAYVWCEVPGFSKFGEYTSTGSSGGDGPFIYTGFKPKHIIIAAVAQDQEVEIYDNSREGYNEKNYHLNANLSTADDTNAGRLDLYSNGFKILVGPSGPINDGTAGTKYVYHAWGQSIVGSNNIPCVAR